MSGRGPLLTRRLEVSLLCGCSVTTTGLSSVFVCEDWSTVCTAGCVDICGSLDDDVEGLGAPDILLVDGCVMFWTLSALCRAT